MTSDHQTPDEVGELLSFQNARNMQVTPAIIALARSLQARLRVAERELDLMKNAGIIEVSVRNPAVAEYIKHWEGRTEKAERELGEYQAKHTTIMQEADQRYVEKTRELRKCRKVVALADELCAAIENSEADIGGSRQMDKILAELGPAVDAALNAQKGREDG